MVPAMSNELRIMREDGSPQKFAQNKIYQNNLAVRQRCIWIIKINGNQFDHLGRPIL
jgi:hypothetical protein